MTLRLIKLHLTLAHSSPPLVRLGWSEKHLLADISQVGKQKCKGDLPFPVQLCLSQIRLTRLTWRFWLWIFSFDWICWRLLNQIYRFSEIHLYIHRSKYVSLWMSTVSPACPVGKKGNDPWLIPWGRGCNIPNSDLHHQPSHFQRLHPPEVWLKHLLWRE